MRSLIISMFLTAVLCSCATDVKRSGDYTLYLVRHAEKQPAVKMAEDNEDPALTAAGEKRADNLAVILRDKNISDVWSSDFQRTRQTAAPLAAELDLEVKTYNPKDLQWLVSELHKRQRNALIVGHSNTTPELASLLCECSVKEMDETEYDRLLVVKVNDGSVTIET